jgi:enoyl-CoA hydratase
VNHVTASQEALLEKSREILHKIMKKGPVAVAQTIRAVDAAFLPVDGYQVEAEAFAVCCQTQDFKEGTQAFLEKREAKFTGK